ncbi:MAG: cystathionine gamma-lyase [Gemmatimonadaceae bacterium]|nr:cystathionine gamma-lyase [Gemmatimonadaceae bacterium]
MSADHDVRHAWHDGTKVVHAGLPPRQAGAPYLPGPTFAAPYHTPGNPADSAFTYGRFHNPTWQLYEQALETLEGGPAVLFPSGMAASAAVLATVLKPGDKLVMPAESYYTTRLIATEHFAPMGIEVVSAPTANDAQRALLQGARLLWLESPTNPELDVCDIARLCEAAHAAGALVAVDNTTATPLGQRPLALGADFAIVSDTKAMTGHADLVLGHVATKDPLWAETVRTYRTRMGTIPGPMEVWLAHRSLGTLSVRLSQQCASALEIAAYLAAHPKVSRVRYPGLRSDPAFATASKQMTMFGPVIGFELADRESVERFFAASALVFEATSFGGIHTSAERRARWGADAVSEGFVRLSIGLEDVRDLRNDFAVALGAV